MEQRTIGRAACWVAFMGLMTSVPASWAHAGGYEFPGDGTRAIGRGGAFSAKADDPMAVVVNPAALASLPGIQVMGSMHLLIAKDCFDRSGSWDAGWGEVNGSAIPYTEVCSTGVTPLPSLGVSWRVNRKIGMGFMLIPPNSEQSQTWGGHSYGMPIAGSDTSRELGGYVGAPTGASSGGTNPVVPLDNGESLLPAPTRFLLIDRKVTLLYPTFGIGVRPMRWLQLGASLGWGIAAGEFTIGMRNLNPGEEPSPLEGQSHLSGHDWFVPRVVASVHVIPHDRVDIVTVFRWDDAIRLQGPLEASVPVFDDTAMEPNPLTGTGTLTAPRPWWLSFGVRYADRITPRSDGPEDSMTTTRWDVELDVVYERNRVVDSFDIQIQNLNSAGGALADPINTTVALPHNWQDQLSVRLGGDWNVIQERLALRSGVSYETSGFTGMGSQTSKTATIDFIPGRRFGLHSGGSLRVGKERNAELSGAFSVFWIAPHNHAGGGTEQIVIDPLNGGSQVPGTTVNNGRVTSRYIVLSVMYRHFFQGGKVRGMR